MLAEMTYILAASTSKNYKNNGSTYSKKGKETFNIIIRIMSKAC